MIDLLRSITDPEHPVSLEQLRVVTPEDIHVAGNRVLVYLTPTIPHCSMSTLIGMSCSFSDAHLLYLYYHL
jgi:metal-sulfur cluster biosynthetic enzyme